MRTLGFLVEKLARERPTAPAVIVPQGMQLDFASLAARARHLARHFADSGLSAGDRLAIAMSNHPAFFEVLLGAWQAGLIVAPMNPRLHPREFAALMQDCEAKLCVATPDLAADIAACDPERVMMVAGSERHLSAVTDHAVSPSREGGACEAAWLFYTSGTTGRAKGATLTHGNLNAMIESFLADSGCAVDEAMLHTAPLSHAGGLLSLAFMQRGLPQIIMSAGLDAAALAEALAAWSRSSFFAVPTLLNRLADPAILDPDLHSRIAKIMFGGAPMYVEDLKRAISVFGPDRLWGGYGQGEAPCTITHLSSGLLADSGAHDREELLGSVGLPRSGVEVRVVDEAGRALEPGETGEVEVRGDVVMSGYWKRPEATAETLVNGWLRTGDIGRFGPTELLTLVDRAKDVIISGGSNIYPREIEEALLRHPEVREVAVVGMRDAEWGELPFAFIVAERAVSTEELDEFCRSQIARYKRPRGYRMIDALPKSSYGKVLKSALRDQLAETRT